MSGRRCLSRRVEVFNRDRAVEQRVPTGRRLTRRAEEKGRPRKVSEDEGVCPWFKCFKCLILLGGGGTTWSSTFLPDTNRRNGHAWTLTTSE
jgi:hypothetical protein